MEIIRYSAEICETWDDLVRKSRNGTFLFERQFMDYHADRFEDISLLFTRKGKILGVLPCSAHGDSVVSHGGLTYGGFLLSEFAHAIDVCEMLEAAMQFFKAQNYKTLVIKPIPSIYHTHCSEEELYWLYRKGAALSARGLSSAINLTAPLPFSTLRKRKLNKATKSGLMITENIPATNRHSWAAYWAILSEVLAEQHARTPVHTLEEILLLKSRFPKEIQLWVVTNAEGSLVAGTVLFCTSNVIHAQYIAASHEGKELGALDLLFHHIVEKYKYSVNAGVLAVPHSRPRFLDFGISTEDAGAYLNEGLIFQKEGFGARSVVYDAYTLTL